MGEQEGRDARGVRLEGEHLKIEHEADVFLITLRDAGRFFVVRHGLGKLVSAGETPLNVADGREILVQFLLVGVAEVFLQGAGILHHKVEHALVEELAFGAGGVLFAAAATAAEQALEGQLGIAFRSKRGGLAFPGQIELIGTGITAVTIPRPAGFVAAQFQGRQAGELADVVGSKLVDGDPVADIGPGRFTGLHAGQEAGVGAGVVAAAIPVGAGLFVFQAGDDLEFRLQVLERGQGGAEVVTGAVLFGRPVFHILAVGRIHKSHAQGQRAGGSGLGRGRPGGKRGRGFQGRQGHERAETAEETAAGKFLGHDVLGKIWGREETGADRVPGTREIDGGHGCFLSTFRNARRGGNDAALHAGEIRLRQSAYARLRILRRSPCLAP